MDWSLVLASQGIEAEILNEEDSWQLGVAESEHDRALHSIKLYRAENRGWKWQQKLPGSDLLFHWGSLFWVIGIIWLYSWSSGAREPLGLMNNKAVAEGEWWRLFTAVTMHGDLGHLAANVTTGVVLLGLAMARYGAGFALFTAYLAGAGGNLAGYIFYDHTHRGLGASGMVMGALGLLAVQPFVFQTRKFIAAQIIFRSFLAGAFMLMLLGTAPGTDILAHFGGFVFGALFGVLLNFLPARREPSITDKICLAAVPIAVILTWASALR